MLLEHLHETVDLSPLICLAGQESGDMDALKKNLPMGIPYKIFADIIHEKNEVLIHGEVQVFPIARSEYDRTLEWANLIRTQLLSALQYLS